MLKTLRLKNFKSHANSKLSLGRITVLIGPQGTGKSSVLQALALLRDSAGREGLSFSGSFKDLEFVDIIHQRKERSLLKFGIDFQFAGAPAFMSETGEYSLSYETTLDNHGFRENRATYEFGDRTWEFKTPRRSSGRWTVPPDFILPDRPPVKFGGSTFILHPFTYKVDAQDYPLHRGINDLRLAITDFFQLTQFVPEGRLMVDDTYELIGTVNGSPRTMTEVVNKLATGWDMRDEVSDYLNRIVGRRINFRPAGDEILVEAADGLGVPYPVTCEGGGLRSLIWPLAAITFAEPGSLVAVEEPENHLHPKALAKLSEVLIDTQKDKGIQLIMTTHNEHLLFSLLLAVSQGKLSSDELVIYSFSEKDSRSTVQRLEVDEKGSVKGGLPGFFEASVDQIGEYIKSRRSKSKGATINGREIRS